MSAPDGRAAQGLPAARPRPDRARQRRAWRPPQRDGGGSLPEPPLQQTCDLFLAEVTTAWADPRVFSAGRWHFEGHDELRTLPHVAGGHHLTPGVAVVV